MHMRVAHLAQEHGIFQNIAQITGRLGRLWHAGERGKLVHHAPDIADLPDNRVRALVEHLAVFLIDLLAIAAADAFRRQLDRRQRVLDLMRDTPRHIRPRG